MGRTLQVPILAAFVGAIVWNSFLLLRSMKLREHWPVVQTYSHQIDLVVGVVLLAAIAWFVRSRLSGAHIPKEEVKTEQ